MMKMNEAIKLMEDHDYERIRIDCDETSKFINQHFVTSESQEELYTLMQKLEAYISELCSGEYTNYASTVALAIILQAHKNLIEILLRCPQPDVKLV